ncbi:AAA family ATPase [Methylobacterium sp. NPDC080182]|uniref:AAA family ATPase n=1 Tax=Methylobacterium sp. NPDC080182 TaxID=3390590 RepID=UPI003D09493A
MLIRFGAANSSSIKDYQELSLVASSLTDTGVDLIEPDGLKDKILPFVMIYGANAAGKTNLIAALSHMADQVQHSYTGLQPGAKIPRSTFKLDPDTQSGVSRNDCDFMLDGVRYHYGFTYNDETYIEEWLYAYPERVRQTWFYRRPGEPFIFGKNLKGRNRAIEDLTRSNSLFLSTAAQNNHPQLSAVYQFFSKSLHFAMDPFANEYNVARVLVERQDDKRIIEFLRLADVGINDIRFEPARRKNQPDDFMEDLKAFMKKHAGGFSLEEENLKVPLLGHSDSNGMSHFFRLSDESRGTLRLISLIAPVLEALDTGGVFVVDEIDASLHTLLALKIVELFSNRSTNPNGGQLISTTHDTNILCSKNIRRDQIWFAEKEHGGNTVLYPLSDLKIRKSDNIERGYIQGRFGAIPFFGSIEQMISTNEQTR